MREPPGTVTLVPTAALTSIAMAVRKEPRIVERVAEACSWVGPYGLDHARFWDLVLDALERIGEP